MYLKHFDISSISFLLIASIDSEQALILWGKLEAKNVSIDCLQSFLLLFMSLLTALTVKNSYILAEV